MKDKNIIAKNDKSFFLFISLISFASLFIQVYWLTIPSLRWVGIFFISTLIFMFVLGIVMFVILPKNAIVQEQENLVVYQGLFKESISFSDVLKVEFACVKRDKKKNGGIILTAKSENGGEKKFSLTVKDKEQAVQKIREMIQEISLSSRMEATIPQDVE